MAQKGTYRSKFEERDLSGYIEASFDTTGAMVIKSPKGFTVPKKCTMEDDVIRIFGTPSADYPEIFEALAYVQEAPLWVASAVSDDARWGGVYITETGFQAFTGGQVNPDNMNYSQVAVKSTQTLGVGDAVNKSWSGVLSNAPIETSIRLRRGSISIDADDLDGNITGGDIDGTGTIDYATGAIAFDTTMALSSGTNMIVDYDHQVDMASDISHVFFAASPQEDDISIIVQNVEGSKFRASIYNKSTGNLINEYNYSLIREKDGFGSNLYILDVFDQNDYVIAKVNSNYTGTVPTIPTTSTPVPLAGGRRGKDPTTAVRSTVWQQFRKPNKYAANLFMDTTGECFMDIYTILNNYQFYSFGLTVIPKGKTVAQMISYRKTELALDFDSMALYCNWRKIYDAYNDSFAWISNVGCAGVKFAQMAPMFFGLSPAGVDENGYGGQIRSYRTIEMEHDFDDFDLKDLDDEQINPIIFDQEGYGLMMYGDRTLQISSSDTSFIHTRRIDSYIIERVVKDIMRLREFKNNTPTSQLRAKAMIDEFLSPILAKELITEVEVICDERNNTPAMRTQRKFIVDIIKKSTVNNQKTLLRLTKIGQGAVISEVSVV